MDRLLRHSCNLGPEVVPAKLMADVSCLLGAESVPLQLVLFPKFWLDLCERLKEVKKPWNYDVSKIPRKNFPFFSLKRYLNEFFFVCFQGKDVQDRIDALKNCEFFREYVDAVFLSEPGILVHHSSSAFSFVKEVLKNIAPQIVSADTRRSAMENAVCVLSESQEVLDDADPGRLPLIMNNRVGVNSLSPKSTC